MKNPYLQKKFYRTIYESGDAFKFSRELDKRIAQYDRSILRICTYHYQGFLGNLLIPLISIFIFLTQIIDSVSQLRGLKENCREIKVAANNQMHKIFIANNCAYIFS